MATADTETRTIATAGELLRSIHDWSRSEGQDADELCERIVHSCLRNPALIGSLSAYSLDQARAISGFQALLEERAEEDERAAQRPCQVAAFVDEAPARNGAPAAIVDRGGSRLIMGLAPGLSLDDLRAAHNILINEEGLVLGTLNHGYAAPAEVGQVREVPDKSHILVDLHNDLLRVTVIHALRGRFNAGDRALIDRRHLLAIEWVERENPAQWHFEGCVPERFSDVAGQDEAVDAIEQHLFYAMQHPELATRLGIANTTGILLHGPTGCGKTLLGKATAGEMQNRLGRRCEFLKVKAGQLKSKWYGETTANVQALWSAARDRARQGNVVVIFLDEADSLGSARGTQGDFGMRADNDATNAWLGEMDGLDTDKSLSIACVASTNLPQALDSAFAGRFALHLPMRRPNAEGAERILALHLAGEAAPAPDAIERAVDFIFDSAGNAVLHAVLRDGHQMEVVRRAHLVNGRLLSQASDEARWQLLRDVVDHGAEPVLCEQHIISALEARIAVVAGQITPHNITEFVDMPALHGQVARIVPAPEAALGASTWRYIE